MRRFKTDNIFFHNAQIVINNFLNHSCNFRKESPLQDIIFEIIKGRKDAGKNILSKKALC